MKSVVAEASSIAKAIELAWQKAGQPKEFLIKVFQEPQRNMFGLTKTSAKVGIFFDDAALNQKIKTAMQSTTPIANHNTQKPIHSNPQNKQISPIKPLNSKTGPKPQGPRQPKPANKLPVAPVVNQPAIEPITPQPSVTETSVPNQPAQGQTGQPRTATRKKYYHRRKPRAPRPNGDGNIQTGPVAPINKSDS